MKTINRIMLSSTFLALFSIFAIFSVAIAVIYILSTGNGGGGFDLMESEIIYAGSIVEESNTSDWRNLSNNLAKHGYNLYVTDSDGVVFSSLDNSQEATTENLKRLKLKQNVLIASVSDMAVAAKSDGNFSIYAIKGSPSQDNFWAGFMSPFIVAYLMVTAIILILSQLFIRKMAWRVLRPLNALEGGANRIKNGDFSQPIEYEGDDEFAHVCAAFNHMQKSLLEEQEKNAAYEQARTDMIAGISHDLRTPLTSVKGYIKGLCDGVANTPEKQDQYLSIAYQKACDMDTLLEKLFFFSKLETGNLPLSLGFHDLGDFIRQSSEELQLELAEKGAELTVDVTPVSHPVKIDPEQMRRVLYNLTENALHYANAHPLKLHISVWQEYDKEHLLFTDNGQGVPEDMLSHLFERFWRGDESRGTHNNEGSGLGLYIVKYITLAHGGHVTAKNGGGLAVQITLPCRKEEDNE
ncbi:sensor protein kinase WalK [Oxobacter pfennigii]|uniref:histidine kinase n=1 Tax=Oxobacter pfennigii TaxID=36849 RepID=A0A0P8W9K5_9CLOT|nr:HAMP domain-containing sensor histidine kinase [Oxobacter pfennigii]KPU44370.1 sensor protein kinase WalK [Oxobacter pfennigii]